MENLAGRSNATEVIQRELARCGIEPFIDPDYRHPEVHTNTLGRLKTEHGEYRFHRNWHYWVVNGPVPLEIAKRMYAHPVGRNDIRVDGHCGWPPPEAPWVTWHLPDGREVIPFNQKAEFEKFMAQDDFMGRSMREAYAKYEFHDDPASIGATPTIDCYHIDSELGLYLFVQFLTEKKGYPNLFTYR